MTAVHSKLPTTSSACVQRAGRDEYAPFEVLYDRLRRICDRHMLSERSGHTLQGTALAHEVFIRIRLHDPEAASGSMLPTRWFLAAASTAIRQVVVDHARTRRRLKRGAGWSRDDHRLADVGVDSPEHTDAILVADELLTELASVSPLQAQIAQLRFFCGLSFARIAPVVGLAEHEVRREWRLAQVWLGSRPSAQAWRR